MYDLAIVLIAVGLPVVCGTIIALEGMKRKDRRRREAMNTNRGMNDREAEIIEEIYQGLKALRNRIENLETIYQARTRETKGKE